MVNESIATTRVYDRAYDEQIPLGNEGYYTIVISHPCPLLHTEPDHCGCKSSKELT